MTADQLDEFQAWLQRQAGEAHKDAANSRATSYFNGRECAFNDAFEYLGILMGKSPKALVPPWVGKLRHARGLCDDWGCLRDESGKVVLQVNCGLVLEKDLYGHRKNGTDPTQPVVDYLLAVINGPNAPASGPAGLACPHCGSGLLWSEDRGAHCDGCDEYHPESDLPPTAPAPATEGRP